MNISEKNSHFKSKVLYQHPRYPARVMELTTYHGKVITPVFMPVGTRAGVNNMMPSELRDAKASLILGGNTYHMLCAPGMAVIQAAGGMHPFMGWDGPMLTDSGGFQVFSLSKNHNICTIDEEGAHFKLPDDNRIIHMTPEMSLETQKIIGADIIMAFDQCTPDNASHEVVLQIMQRTHRWLRQSMDYHAAYPTSRYGYYQALFGIIQGGIYQDLREESAETVVGLNPDGIAIGGETIGFDMQKTREIIGYVLKGLPPHKPRYTMGVGLSPQDLLDVVKEGIDMFDCVAPTRNARHGALYSGELIEEKGWLRFASDYDGGRLSIKKSNFSSDLSPVMATCTCYTCQHHTRASLHHLYKQKAPVFTALASIHNVHVMVDVCIKMRDLIMKAHLENEK